MYIIYLKHVGTAVIYDVPFVITIYGVVELKVIRFCYFKNMGLNSQRTKGTVTHRVGKFGTY